jgi:hypothetical protein
MIFNFVLFATFVVNSVSIYDGSLVQCGSTVLYPS